MAKEGNSNVCLRAVKCEVENIHGFNKMFLLPPTPPKRIE